MVLRSDNPVADDSTPNLVEEILDAARRHGQASESDHEVGDLQDALRIAWAQMSPEQRTIARAEYFSDHDDWIDQRRERPRGVTQP